MYVGINLPTYTDIRKGKRKVYCIDIKYTVIKELCLFCYSELFYVD